MARLSRSRESVPIRRLALAAAVPVLLLASRPQSDPLAARTKGRPTAPVTVYEMADFQCPACREFALQTMPALEREFIRTGKVRWVFINYPLKQVHPNAVAAAEAAMCAARQDKFWEMHDLLFQRQLQWARLPNPRRYLIALADSAGARSRPFTECFTEGATRREVEEEAQRATRAGARATPSFYIEGGLLEGAAPLAVFRQVLDSLHRARTAAARPPL